MSFLTKLTECTGHDQIAYQNTTVGFGQYIIGKIICTIDQNAKVTCSKFILMFLNVYLECFAWENYMYRPRRTP